jgi:peptidoglycan/LPS O-acetylase OafA/YrhL
MKAAKVIPALDGLRGVAAVLVVVCHFVIDSGLGKQFGRQIGTVGVFTFFGLSGFLMMHVTWGRPCTWPEIRKFYWHRLSRVVPLFLIVALSAYPYQLIARSFDVDPRYLGFKAIQNLEVALLNIALIRGDSVLWTIGPELMFYLIFPVFWFGVRHSSAAAFAVMGCFLAAQWMTGFQVEPKLNFTKLNMVLQFFIGGMAAYIIYASRLQTLAGPRMREGYFCIIMLLYLAAWPGISKALFGANLLPKDFWEMYTAQPLYWLLIPMVVLACASSQLASQWLGNKIFRFLGAISYSIYLLHPVTTRFTLIFIPNGQIAKGLFFFACTLPLTIFVAWLSFRYIERPAQRWLNGWLDKRQSASAPGRT